MDRNIRSERGFDGFGIVSMIVLESTTVTQNVFLIICILVGHFGIDTSNYILTFPENIASYTTVKTNKPSTHLRYGTPT